MIYANLLVIQTRDLNPEKSYHCGSRQPQRSGAKMYRILTVALSLGIETNFQLVFAYQVAFQEIHNNKTPCLSAWQFISHEVKYYSFLFPVRAKNSFPNLSVSILSFQSHH